MANISNNYFAFYINLLEMDNREFLNGMEQMRRRMDPQEVLSARLRGRIFHLEEEVRVTGEELRDSRLREAASLLREQEFGRRVQETERRLDESWRWERSYQVRGERAENAARIWEQRARWISRWDAETGRRRDQEWAAEFERRAMVHRAEIEERERLWLARARE